MPDEAHTQSSSTSRGEEQIAHLRQELRSIAEDAQVRAQKVQFWAVVWQVADVALGLPTAILAAVSGATGLVSAAGRVPAAFMALGAAALAAATGFLRSQDRYERNRRRENAFRTLEAEARLALAREGYQDAEAIYAALRRLLAFRVEILNMGLSHTRQLHAPSPPTTSSEPASLP